MPEDVRGIANLILEVGRSREVPITNLSMNKLVYFLHAHYLGRFRKPLVSAKIEAWDYGPVFRELYHEFKNFDRAPINRKATRLDPESGERSECVNTLSEKERQFLIRILDKYIGLTSSALVAISHERGGPWDQVWNHAGKTNPSMRISDELIREWYSKAARH